jgi:hypothetical protein
MSGYKVETEDETIFFDNNDCEILYNLNYSKIMQSSLFSNEMFHSTGKKIRQK